jgi:hypothetical protein
MAILVRHRARYPHLAGPHSAGRPGSEPKYYSDYRNRGLYSGPESRV